MSYKTTVYKDKKRNAGNTSLNTSYLYALQLWGWGQSPRLMPCRLQTRDYLNERRRRHGRLHEGTQTQTQTRETSRTNRRRHGRLPERTQTQTRETFTVFAKTTAGRCKLLLLLFLTTRPALTTPLALTTPTATLPATFLTP